MRTEERRDRIITLLFENRVMKVADLIDQVGDSPSSIRRDLTYLEKNGTIERSFGYAKYARYIPNAGNGSAASPEALIMANTAAQLVRPNDIVMLDNYPVLQLLAGRIKDIENIVIITNSIPTANDLIHSRTTVYVTGGYMHYANGSLLQSEAEAYLQNVHSHIAFTYCMGIHNNAGPSCMTPEQCQIKKAFIRNADKTALLIEEDKLNVDSIRMFATFREIDYVITAKPIENRELVKAMTAAGVTLLHG